MVNIETMNLLASEVAHRASLTNDELATRVFGRRFKQALDDMLASVSETTCVILDFPVKTESSFMDEVFGNLASEHSSRQGIRRCLILRSIPEVTLENLSMALESRAVKREPGLRNCVIPVIKSSNNVELVGKSEGHVEETFRMLLQYQQLRTRDVATACNLSVAAASTRLKSLYDLGLAIRFEEHDDQGLQYVYVWPLD